MNWNTIFLDIADKLKKGSKCVKLQVGCIIVKDNRIISSGVNGTPSGFDNCDSQFPNGIITKEDIDKHYTWSKLHETHAEMNAILSAAKSGINIDDSIMYVTSFPCSECLKNMIQLGIKAVYFLEYYSFADIPWSIDYADKNGMRCFMLTPDSEWTFRRITLTNYDET